MNIADSLSGLLLQSTLGLAGIFAGLVAVFFTFYLENKEKLKDNISTSKVTRYEIKEKEEQVNKILKEFYSGHKQNNISIHDNEREFDRLKEKENELSQEQTTLNFKIKSYRNIIKFLTYFLLISSGLSIFLFAYIKFNCIIFYNIAEILFWLLLLSLMVISLWVLRYFHTEKKI